MHNTIPSDSNNNLRGIYCILIGMVIVTIQDSTVKWLSPDYSLHQIMFVRSAIGLIIAITIIVMDGGLQLMKTRHLGLQLTRGGLLIIANMALFMAVAAMPIAEAIAIFFVGPLFITVLSIPILKEQVGPRRWLAVIIGLSGVIIMMEPTAGIFDWASLLPLIAALAYALMQMLTRKLGITDKASTMTFYNQSTLVAVSLIIGLLIGDGKFSNMGHASLDFLFRAWIIPAQSDLWIFLVLGLTSGFGSYLLSQAYRLGEATLIAPFEYVSLPMSVVLGYLLWQDFPSYNGFAGMTLILGAGLYVLYREKMTIEKHLEQNQNG